VKKRAPAGPFRFLYRLWHGCHSTDDKSAWMASFDERVTNKNPTPRVQMLNGFNKGWIDFEGDASSTRKGAVSLDAQARFT